MGVRAAIKVVFLLAAIGFVSGLGGKTASAFETRATAAYVVDYNTGAVLLAKNADTPVPPASMSKLMTLYIAFEAIERGQLSLDEMLPTSSHASSFGGSTLFLRPGERVSVEDLLRGVIVLSGNDASVVLAEALSPDGTESGFAQFMTQRAQQLGLTNSTFVNSTGWPADGHLMSMRDLGLLSKRLIEDFPQYYAMFSEREFVFDENESANRANRNPLLGLGIGADGLKTGHTREAGFGLTGSAKQGERRIIFAITGLQSAQARAEESEAIVNWAFRQFTARRLAEPGEEIARAQLWEGAEQSVGLVALEPIDIVLPVLTPERLEAEVVYEGPIIAPIQEGAQIAQLIVRADGVSPVSVPLYAKTTVAHGGVFARLRTASRMLIAKVLPKKNAEVAAVSGPAE